jgi:hypothetical protein
VNVKYNASGLIARAGQKQAGKRQPAPLSDYIDPNAPETFEDWLIPIPKAPKPVPARPRYRHPLDDQDAMERMQRFGAAELARFNKT